MYIPRGGEWVIRERKLLSSIYWPCASVSFERRNERFPRVTLWLEEYLQDRWGNLPHLRWEVVADAHAAKAFNRYGEAPRGTLSLRPEGFGAERPVMCKHKR